MDMQEISYKEMKFNPFNLIGGEWMLVTAGNERLDSHPSMLITPSISKRPSWCWSARSYMQQSFRRVVSSIRTPSTRAIPCVTSTPCTSVRLRRCW